MSPPNKKKRTEQILSIKSKTIQPNKEYGALNYLPVPWGNVKAVRKEVR
jgi:hypothetical protein